MIFNELRSFCWTKIQAEGGQSLSEILRRKELERAAGGGIFYWGVGNSLGKNAAVLLSGEVDKIVFSKMLSAPKKIDVNPGAVSVWLNCKDLLGNISSIPPHVVIISRAHSNGRVKNRHYALVCQSDEPLALREHGAINTARYRNYASSNPRIGHSQVTAILERNQRFDDSINDLGLIYEANIIARLVEPFFVTLMNPVVLTSTEASKLKTIISDTLDASEYMRKIHQFREGISERLGFPIY